jgi:rhomboid protease GluP
MQCHIQEMEPQVVIRENWFSRPPKKVAKTVTILMSFLLFISGVYYLQNIFQLQDLMSASADSVFHKKEYWRLWTTLFAHGDMGHLMNNALLFIPLTYLLAAYYGPLFFPVFGLLLGGLTNAIVLSTMPAYTQLIGISGVVYWMGGAWLTLFLIIDRRKNLKYRFANVLFLMLMIFIPETYWPHISYLSHFVGFVFGILSAITLYYIKREQFLKAEVVEYIYEDHFDDEIFDIIPDDKNDLHH